MSNIDSFLKLFEYLKSISTIINYDEDDNNVKIQFSSKMKNFISMSYIDWISEDLDEGSYKFVVKYENINVTYQNLTTKKFDEEKSAILTLHFNKEEKLYCENKNVLLFFENESFISKLQQTDFSFFVEDNFQKFIFLPINESYSNGIVNIFSINDFYKGDFFKKEIKDEIKTKLENIKEIFKEYNNIDNLPTPLTLRFEGIREGDIQGAFNYCVALLTCSYFANKIYNDTFIFKGYQNVEVKKGNFFSPENTGDFSFLFELVSDKEKFVDKIEIARNIFSLYLSDKDSVEDLDSMIKKIRGTIEDHFHAYIQKQIKDFFNQRKDLVKEAYSVAIQAKDVSDKIVGNINLMLLGLVTASLTGIFAFSKGDKFIFLLALVFHTLYFLINFIVNVIHLKDKRDDIEKSFDNYVAQFAIIKDTEVKKIKEAYLLPALKRLKKTLRWYVGVSIFLILLLSVTTYWGFNNKDDTNKQENKDTFHIIAKK